jgi:transcription elongation GreA/GreB family factor
MTTERIKAFAATISDAKRKLGEIDDALASNTKAMSQLDFDGDMMDDPLLHQAQYQRGHFEGTRAELQEFLSRAEPLSKADINREDGVTYGHRVTLSSDEGDEQLTLGQMWDVKYMSRENSEKYRVISDTSPMGRALLGKRRGDTSLCVVGSETIKVVIKNHEVSALVID